MAGFKLHPSSPHVVTPFYTKGKPFYCLTNFSEYDIVDNEHVDPITGQRIIFPTVEHYFQARKIWGNDSKYPKHIQKQYLDAILGNNPAKPTSSKHALKIAKEWTEDGKGRIHAWGPAEKADWNGVVGKPGRKIEVMDHALNLKLTRHPEVAKALIATGDSCLVADTATSDPVENEWGWGDQGLGNNLLGKAWMRKRNNFHKAMKNPHLVVDPDAKYFAVQNERQKWASLKRDLGSVSGYGIPVAGIVDPTLGVPAASSSAGSSHRSSTPASASKPHQGGMNGFMDGLNNIGKNLDNLFSGKDEFGFLGFFKKLFEVLTELFKPLLGALGFNFNQSKDSGSPSTGSPSSAHNAANAHTAHSPTPTHAAPAKRLTWGSGPSGHAPAGHAKHAKLGKSGHSPHHGGKGMGFSKHSKAAGLGGKGFGLGAKHGAHGKHVRFADGVSAGSSVTRDDDALRGTSFGSRS